MTFGERLRTARKAKQLTQKQLAARIKAAHNSISNWENNQNMPDPDAIQHLCWALDVQPNYFFSVDTISPPAELSPSLQTLDNALSQLNEEGQEKLLDYAADLVASGRYKEDASATSNKTNVVKFAARNGELTEERLTDEEVAARMASDDLLPDAEL